MRVLVIPFLLSCFCQSCNFFRTDENCRYCCNENIIIDNIKDLDSIRIFQRDIGSAYYFKIENDNKGGFGRIIDTNRYMYFPNKFLKENNLSEYKDYYIAVKKLKILSKLKLFQSSSDENAIFAICQNNYGYIYLKNSKAKSIYIKHGEKEIAPNIYKIKMEPMQY